MNGTEAGRGIDAKSVKRTFVIRFDGKPAAIWRTTLAVGHFCFFACCHKDVLTVQWRQAGDNYAHNRYIKLIQKSLLKPQGSKVTTNSISQCSHISEIGYFLTENVCVSLWVSVWQWPPQKSATSSRSCDGHYTAAAPPSIAGVDMKTNRQFGTQQWQIAPHQNDDLLG